MQENGDLDVLMTVPRETEAQLIVDALAEKGIEAHQAGGAISTFKVGVPGEVLIYVKPEDRARAAAALAEIRDEADHIDWSQIDWTQVDPDESEQ